MKPLHLFWKFHGYIFNGLRENEFENCYLKYSVSTLTDSLWYIIGVNNHWKDVILFSKTFQDGWQMMDNDSTIHALQKQLSFFSINLVLTVTEILILKCFKPSH